VRERVGCGEKVCCGWFEGVGDFRPSEKNLSFFEFLKISETFFKIKIINI
jgi:hypothetical protein